MDSHDSGLDDSRRRAFVPPRERRSPRRSFQRPQLNLWHLRYGFGIGVVRAACAVGFGFVPGVSGRFGDSGLAVVCLALAAAVFGLVVMLYRMSRPVEWSLLADAATLFVLVPVLITASGIEVADARFGGRSINFLAAASAIVLLYVVITAIATRGGADRTSSGQIGALPGAMSIAVVLLGTSYFSAGTLWRGLSIAWMAAAFVTVLAAVVPIRFRLLVAPAAFALFAAGVVLPDVLGDGEPSLSSTSSAIAVATTAVVAAILMLIPATTRSRPAGPAPD